MELQDAIQVLKDNLRTGTGLYDSWYKEIFNTVKASVESEGLVGYGASTIANKSARAFLSSLTSHDFVAGDPILVPPELSIKQEEETFEHKVTQEDLDNNPTLADEGVVVGEIIELPVNPSAKPPAENLSKKGDKKK